MQFIQSIFLFFFLSVSFLLIFEKSEAAFFNFAFEDDPVLTSDDCSCRFHSSSRIINGEMVDTNSIPWQVSLGDLDDNHFCGGVIVSHSVILTAAHCVHTRTADSIKVRVGTHDLRSNSKTHLVDLIVFNYTSSDQPGDIALLELKTPIKFIPSRVEPACLNLKKKSYEFQDLMASGWGHIVSPVKSNSTKKMNGGQISPFLRHAYFFEDSDSDCEEYLICIDSANGESVCKGDSGGPLHSEPVNGEISVEGIASYVNIHEYVGDEAVVCTGSAAYARLSYYKDWLESKIEDNYCVADA